MNVEREELLKGVVFAVVGFIGGLVLGVFLPAQPDAGGMALLALVSGLGIGAIVSKMFKQEVAGGYFPRIPINRAYSGIVDVWMERSMWRRVVDYGEG